MLDKDILESIKKDNKLLVKAFTQELIVASDSYYRSKGTTSNMFKTSELIRTVKAVITSEGISILAKDYIEYLDKGRRPNTRKVPIQAILKWLSKVGLPANNSTAFRIQQSIYKKGIKPRNFINRSLDKVVEELDNIVDKTLDDYFNRI